MQLRMPRLNWKLTWVLSWVQWQNLNLIREQICCASANTWVLACTDQTCDVQGFHQAFDALADILVAQVVTAVTLENGELITLVINESLYFGSQMDHSLINSKQIQAFGIDVFDSPFDMGKDFRIYHPYCFIPFDVEGSTIYFNSFTPLNEQLKSCPHIKISSPFEWDQSTVHLPHSNKQRNTIEEVSRGKCIWEYSESNIILGNISEWPTYPSFTSCIVLLWIADILCRICILVFLTWEFILTDAQESRFF